MPTIQANGIDIYYEMHGQGEPLLLIAGLACDCLLWTPILNALARHYHVIMFDNRGAGRSSAPDALYSIDQMAADTYALLAQLKISKTHVLGHSLGGAIAQVLAHQHPQIVNKLILCTTSKRFNRVSRLVENNILTLREKAIPIPIMVETILPWLYSSNFLEKTQQFETTKEQMINAPYPQSNAGFKGQYNALATFDSSAWAANISNPTLILAGGEDLLCLHDPDILAKTIKHAQYNVFPHTGHLPFVEEPEDFIRHIIAFMETLF